MGVVIVDGKEIPLEPGEKLNGIQVARKAGVEIPHYCWHAGLTVVASCRMCLVENGKVNDKTGKIEMQPKLVPACQTPAPEGSVFVTNSEKVKNARAMVEEDLLLRHPVDCPICDKAGECALQDYHFEYGREERRADIKPFHSRRRDVGDTVTLFVDRCVMCTRCVRFTREIAGTGELMVINRGAHEEIDTFPGYPLDNKLSGNVVDLCPVGALGDKDFLYSQRVWFMKSHDHVCDGCSTGCSIKVDENQDHIYRLKPRENPNVNQWWMCDEGRYGWKHVHSQERTNGAKRLDAKGAPVHVEWSDVGGLVGKEFEKAGRLAAVLSPHLTVEEAFLLASYVRSIDPKAIIAVGAIPVEDQDEKFKNGFTIRAEKAPNRRGVEKVAGWFQGEVIAWDDFLKRLDSDSDEIRGVWVSGGYKTPWNDEATVAKFAKVKTLVVQDCFTSPLMERATWQLAGAVFAERAGSYVNYSDRLQNFAWAIRSPQGVKTEGQLLWQLTAHTGLYSAKTALAEVCRDVAYFAPAAGEIPSTGIDLKVNWIAASEAPVAAGS